ncbi:MAG: MBL fold metallo-hydrolase [Isosphaeraceae bacterium]|nr:MBL fold metallo-hydrolase [Isosphaeraceae bacterium]
MTFSIRRLFAAFVAVVLLGGADAPRGELRIYIIDVMGGAATLIVTPERESLLIDSGWPGLEDRDPIRIEHILKDLEGLDHLDHLLTTHWHADHYGGVEGLSKRVRIDRYWDRGLPDLDAPGGDKATFPDGPARDDPLGVAYRRASEGKRRALKAGDRLPLKGGIEAVVLASGGEVWQPETAKGPNPLCAAAPADLPPDPSDNARSLALRFRVGEFTFLDCGDLTWNIEKKLVCPTDAIGRIDLFQVTHHGMSISNHPTLVRTIQPTVAIMNNGPRKGGDAGTVRLLRGLPSLKALYQLHKNAATSVEENTSSDLIANNDLAGGQFIRVSVAPDGSTFRVRVGPEGTDRVFESR